MIVTIKTSSKAQIQLAGQSILLTPTHPLCCMGLPVLQECCLGESLVVAGPDSHLNTVSSSFHNPISVVKQYLTEICGMSAGLWCQGC